MSEKNIEWYQEALDSTMQAYRRVTKSYLQAQEGWERSLNALATIRTLAESAEESARTSLSRMHGGAPFPAVISTRDLLAILEDRT